MIDPNRFNLRTDQAMAEAVPSTIETLLIEAVQGNPAHALEHRLELTCETSTPNLGHTFLNAARDHAGRIATASAAVALTYQQLASAALDIRQRLLQSRTFDRGSRVLLLLPNSAEYIAAYYGILLAGGVVVPLAPNTEKSQFRAIRNSTAARHVIAQSRIVRTWTETFAEEIVDDAVTVQLPEELAAIMFTGGSTGTPKGVMLSHQNLIENARSIREYLQITAEDRPLCVLPFYHAFGNSVLQSHLLTGASLVLDGNTMFPETLVDAIAKHQATSLSGVPDLFRFLLERSSLGETALPSLRYMAVAGGALPHDLALQVAAKIAPADFCVMYGQTEATARLAYVPPHHLSTLAAGCIGRAVPQVELDVVDEEGRSVANGTVGEIRARGPNVMLGYWQDHELTAQVLRGGWLHTGDLGTKDNDGWIYHRGRRNALIKIAGYRIHPSDIEEFVTRSLPIEQAVVVPFESVGGVTRLALFARTKSDVPKLGVLDILTKCRSELPRHMVPDEIQFVDSFPLTSAMKIDRTKLIAMANDAQSRKAA